MILPTATAQYSQPDQAQMRRELMKADGITLKRGAAETFWLLQSPNGTTYKGTIDNSGVLTWAAVSR